MIPENRPTIAQLLTELGYDHRDFDECVLWMIAEIAVLRRER